MDSYLLGNLFGRLFVSYAMVWLILWFFFRRNWRTAFRHSYRWYGVLGIIVSFSMGASMMFSGAAI